MELKWIEDFLSLSQHGSFAKAAKSRHITQPAFSRRIKTLEEWIGATLINRDTYPATFTKAGFLFLKSANSLKKQINDSRKEIQSLALNNVNTIKLYTHHALSEFVVCEILKENNNIFDNLVVNVVTNNLHDSVLAFLEKKSGYLISLSFTTFPIVLPISLVESTVIGTDSLVAVVAIDNNEPLFHDKKGQVVPMLSYPPGAFFSQVIEKNNSIKQAACELNTVYINDISSAIKSMVLAGHGIAWLPLSLVKEEINAGKLALFSQKISPINAKIEIFSFIDENRSGHNLLLWEKLILMNDIFKLSIPVIIQDATFSKQ